MPVAASAIYFLNLRGDVLINRLYRDDVSGNMVDAFRIHIMQTKELGTCPVRQIGGFSFLYMRISNVYIVIVVSKNANVACAFKFVVEVCCSNILFNFYSLLTLFFFYHYQAVALFKSYFGGAFDEDAIRNNFVLIYELLDEIMDFGYPQNLAPEILKLYITQEGVRSPFSSKVLMKCFLSGMPDLKLGLNDKIGLEKESQLKSRAIKRYRITEGVNLPFRVLPTIKELGRTRMEVNVKVPMFTASGLRVRFLKVQNKMVSCCCCKCATVDYQTKSFCRYGRRVGIIRSNGFVTSQKLDRMRSDINLLPNQYLRRLILEDCG
ncbi:hypothetical protein B296_00003412 [Ensete ventricosum]|uniref:MHD domain-containing protein n=1 Tax=Ensete ventricosum TaxID=4639 RepID=A0A427AS12_ENSVE|nr:hypothetical protein B296_00003412 [Ensete ventricosum]